MECPAAAFLKDRDGGKAFSVIVESRAGAAIADQVSVRATQMRDDGVDLEFFGGAACCSHCRGCLYAMRGACADCGFAP
jgi:hypothetical protein